MGNKYTVHFSHIPNCTCPDYLFRQKPCKHIIYVSWFYTVRPICLYWTVVCFEPFSLTNKLLGHTQGSEGWRSSFIPRSISLIWAACNLQGCSSGSVRANWRGSRRSQAKVHRGRVSHLLHWVRREPRSDQLLQGRLRKQCTQGLHWCLDQSTAENVSQSQLPLLSSWLGQLMAAHLETMAIETNGTSKGTRCKDTLCFADSISTKTSLTFRITDYHFVTSPTNGSERSR